ncbi:MAG TPA: VCBS repeat-containing protein, partial [Blastocatellia bacterium]
MNRLRWTICFLSFVVVSWRISVEVFSQRVAVPKRPAKPQPGVKLDASPPKVEFHDIAAKAGLTARHVTGAESEKKYIIETTGSGVALFDYDNDGWLDIFLVNGTTLATPQGFPKGQG